MRAPPSDMRTEVWNPTTGCDRISPGCDRCYAVFVAAGLKVKGDPDFQLDGDPRTSGPGFRLTLHDTALDQPKQWRTPRLVLVNTMSDLFHQDVPLSFLQRAFAIMSETPHVYQMLTKRSKRLAELAPQLHWPANVCVGVSIENDHYSYRADHLRQVPATTRFLHLEPLLGPVPSLDLTGISWVVVGRENGPGARPMREEWVVDIRERCDAAGVTFIPGNPGRRPLSPKRKVAGTLERPLGSGPEPEAQR